MTLTRGTRLGPYEILAPLGAGGMGEVYKARDTRLDRTVAVKILPSAVAGDPERCARFEREAKTISNLQHPHICALYDVGEQGGVTYLVMEYLEGETLAQRLSKGPLPLTQVVLHGVEIADAVAQAHRQGIVHRDLKPANVMLTKSGAKVLDFGLAKATAPAGSAQSVLSQMPTGEPLTGRGAILGTFQYMAPEQLEGHEADPRTDIWALGCVLYEMATGRRAFAGKSQASLIAAIVSSEPAPMSGLQPLTPPALEHVVAKCLDKQPEGRWQNAHDVAEELRWVAAQASQAAPTVARARSRAVAHAAWAAVLLVCVATTLAVAKRLGVGPRRETYRFSVPTHGPGYVGADPPAFAIAPDGQALVFMAHNDARRSLLMMRRFDDLTPRPIEGSEGVDFVQDFSPDGRWLLIRASTRLMRLPIGGGPAQLVADGVTCCAYWSAAGVIVFTGADGCVYKVSATGGAPERITTLDAKRFEVTHFPARFLPDGRRFFFRTYERDPNAKAFVHHLYLASIDSKEVRLVGETPSGVRYEGGRLFFVRDGTLLAQPFDLDALAFSGVAEPVADGVAYFKAVGNAYAFVALDGTIAYEGRQVARMIWFDLKGRKLGTLGAPDDISAISLAADGSRVIASVTDPRDSLVHPWEYGIARPTTKRLSFDWAWEGNALLSRDGRRLFYSCDRADYPDVYARAADGSDEPHLVVREPGGQGPSDVTPDGRYLLYWTQKDFFATKTDLWAMPLTGEAKAFPVVRSPAEDYGGRFSPDGRWVAYVSEASGDARIYVKPFLAPGPAHDVSVRGGKTPRWSPDGRTIYFRSGDHRIMAAAIAPTGEAGEPRELFAVDETVRTFDVAPDGQRLLLLVSTEADRSPPINVIVGWRPR